MTAPAADRTPRNDIIRTRHTANATNVAGDIAINGGFITSVGGDLRPPVTVSLPALRLSSSEEGAPAARDVPSLRVMPSGNVLHIMDDEPLALRNDPAKATATTTIVIG